MLNKREKPQHKKQFPTQSSRKFVFCGGTVNNRHKKLYIFLTPAAKLEYWRDIHQKDIF